METLANALWWVMQPCYDLTGNWWMAILLFTTIMKIALMPLSLWCQKNAIVMVQLMPDLNQIKLKYFGDSETIGEKQNELYREKHYHSLLSLVPLAIQILILFGLVDVIHDITDNGAPGTEFLGFIPIEDGSLSWIMPFLAGFSAIIMGFAQNRINPLQKEQSRTEKNVTNGLSIALSFILGVFVATGMAFYWICSNLTAIVVQAICNIVIKPAKYIDYQALDETRNELERLNSLNSKNLKWYQRDPVAKREKRDYKRFFKVVDKHLVFYSEGSSFYRFFEGTIAWLLANSDIRIHYVTNDANDPIFSIAKQQPRIFPYYISEKKAITLMMKMDADVVVSTLEDLETHYIKRSYVRDDIEYIFMFHAMMSTHLAATETAYDHYDTLLCAGPHQKNEIRAAESMRNLKPKRLIECGYDLLDREIEAFAESGGGPGGKPTILLAPSWQESNLLDACIDDMLPQILGKGYLIIVRPHPEYVKRYYARWEAFQKRYEHVSNNELRFEEDASSSESVFASDILVTDWSSIACEFSFATLRPSLFIDTPMKITNPNWEALGIVPTDITLRNQIGVSLDPHDLSSFGETIATMLEESDRWTEAIRAIRENFIYHIGHGAQFAGKYILDAVLEKQRVRNDSLEEPDRGTIASREDTMNEGISR